MLKTATVRLFGLCVTALAYLNVTGCQTSGPPKQALNTDAISAVQKEIKRQVGVYVLASQAKPDAKAEEFACGNGDVDFDISTVKAELTVTTEKSSKTALTLGIPWNGATIGPTGEATKGTTNTQVLTYNLWLTDSNLQAFKDASKAAGGQTDMTEAAIASVLLSLRDALINGAKKREGELQPCFTNYNPDKPAGDAGHTFKLGLTFVKGGKAGLAIKVGIVDLTAGTEWKSTTGNTLTVAFVQRGLEDLQSAKDMADAKCKPPTSPEDPACKKAREEEEKAKKKAGGTSKN